MDNRKRIAMDGNTAAAHVSYAFTEVAAIYPITPSSPMAEITDAWSAEGLQNIFGQTAKVIEMQSEAGAAGTVHGSLTAGALTTTYTASQGLLLMIPNMYKIAGELLPSVIYVSARCVASHALNIFGDHSDVYACRQTGYAMLAASNPQEVMDLGAVSHLATIKGRVPFLSFFDGFRTSHEVQKIGAWDYDELKEMVDQDAITAFRANALNPEYPLLRGSAENGDIFFQNREACNTYYDAMPAIVEEYMDKINAKIGTDYKLFNYYGAPDADRVIICMGSMCDVIEEVVDYMNAAGEKVGLIKVRLYRPFRADKLIEAIPATAKKVAVLDRTKEPGSLGEPLYLDVMTALAENGVTDKVVVGGRYGLGSKDTPPSSVFAIYANLAADKPKAGFTVGIVDDVTNLSLPETTSPDTTPAGTVSCKFWGIGGDGTVSANKNATSIIGDTAGKNVQAYFQYDSKKTGGVTISHLRFGDTKIKAPYYVNKADFIACHVPAYVLKGYNVVDDIKPGGTFLLNCQWTPEELETVLPDYFKARIARNDVKLYIINAIDKAKEIGLGKRTNTILQSAFFKLSGVIPTDVAVEEMKKAAKYSYEKKGMDVVEQNYKAIDAGVDAVIQVNVPNSWKALSPDKPVDTITSDRPALEKFVNEIVLPMTKMEGDKLPVSKFMDYVDGSFPQGSAAFEKRGVAVDVPVWIHENCIQCNRCSYVCPHATIRPIVMDEAEAAAAPAATKMLPMKDKGCESYKYTLAISPLDCMGCHLCARVCPTKTKALEMVGRESQLEQQEVFNYAVSSKVAAKELPFNEQTLKGSQFKQPLLEFSGACAGCVQTAYAKLITQLYGERMYIANSTGCSSIWGGSAPATPYTVNNESKRGPAWANSLFEDTAEFGLGIALGQANIRERLIEKVKSLNLAGEEGAIVKEYLDTVGDGNANEKATVKLVKMLEAKASSCGSGCASCTEKSILAEKAFLSKKSVWAFGGDGWAYDIGFGGLDHAIATGENMNMMVFDTEVYSNTGGQASKASAMGQVAQFAASGRSVAKKSLADIAMSYGYVYVAQVAMGADMNQTLKAIVEAESYDGPSIVIGYSPCEMHGLPGGMADCQIQMKKAVDAGYWHNFRYDPRRPEGERLVLDSPAPTADFVEFLRSETRYRRLEQQYPERAAALFEQAAKEAKIRYNRLVNMSKMY
ncbi:MAG: pyruvate:ferredoxin (flavodoxin) oxidoreductase [Oscillospiraceae bacterium]|nr:pyruvate:ferredoxin (flavodoxin) oxidoreductase [Oscillospiraceae bacterium]